MALREATISLDFGQGVDTKTDPKMVMPAKLLQLQNAVFTKAKSLTKRNGYDFMTSATVGGGTFSAPTMVRSYRNELVCAATTSNGQRLLSYSPSLVAWSDRGKYMSVAVSKQEISSRNPSTGANPYGGTAASSCAILGNYQLFAYYTRSNSRVYISAIDSQTGMHLEDASNTLVATNATLPKVILLGSSALGLLYVTAGTNLVLSVVTISASGISIGAPTTIASGTVISTYDVQTTAAGAVIGYYKLSSSTLSLATVSTSGAVLNTATVASAGTVSSISLNVDSSGQIWAYWADNTTASANNVYYAVFNSTLSITLAKTLIASSVNRVNNITALSTSTTQQTAYFSSLYTDNVTPGISSTIVTSTGSVLAPATFLNNVDIYSKIGTIGSKNYMAVVFTSNLAPTGFLIDLTDGLPVAKFLPTEAEGITGSGTAVVQRPAGFINGLFNLTSTKLFLCSGVVNTLTPQVTDATTTGLVQSNLWTAMSMAAITFDFAHADAFQGVIQQDTLILNGGLVSQYDGSSVCELGFSVDPEVTGSTSASGGSIGSGTWLYYATYEWTDANGNRHQSAPSVAYRAAFTTGTANSVSIQVKTLTLTQKSGVNIVIWKTLSTGTIAYRFASAPNDPTTNFLSFSDLGGTTDAVLQLNEQLYTAADGVVPNIAPPPAMILWTNENRVWCVDSENPSTTIEYCKTASAGTGVSFSTGLLEVLVDSKFGAITGAQPMDEKTVIIKERGLGFFIGDGANDSGTGSSFTQFQVIPSDVGGTGSKSVALIPDGVVFRTLKGIYIVTRGLQVAYFGMAVEGYNSQDITSAIITSNANQLRFLTSSGESLLFDYVMSQWSTFTNHTGYSADIWNGQYVYARTDGKIYKENTTSFLDDTSSYQMVAKTGWLQLNGVQGFQRVKRAAFLGDFANGLSASHQLQASFAYDYETSFTTPIPFTFGSASTSGAYQYRERLPQQKCGTVQLLIQEVTTGASGETITINSMGFEAGVKQGLQKMSQNQTVA